MREPCIDCGTTSGKWRMKERCQSCYSKFKYRQDPQKYIDKANKWRNENPEKYRAGRRKISQRKRDARTPEETLAKNQKEWQAKKARMTPDQRDKRRAYLRQYYRENKAKLKDGHQNAKRRRRARMAQVECTLTAQEWTDIKARFSNRCAYCGRQLTRLQQDHVIPIVHGGPHTAENVVPACKKCNRDKGMQSVDEFLKTRPNQLMSTYQQKSQ